MPISREEFEQGKLDFTIHIVGILESLPNLAFTFVELKEELEAQLGKVSANEQDLALTLRALEAQGKIQSRDVAGREFWIIAPDRLGR